ncbi:MAG: nitric oxide reductase activation protein [Pseudomonadota bacterium]
MVIEFSQAELARGLRLILGPVLSSERGIDHIATSWANLKRKDQEFCIRWTNAIAKSNYELGLHFAESASDALGKMDDDTAHLWAQYILARYDEAGRTGGTHAIDCKGDFVTEMQARKVRVCLSEIQSVFETVLQGMSGRELTLRPGDKAWTDSVNIFLPKEIERFGSAEHNYSLYKISAVMVWAQIRFGTFRRRDIDEPHLEDRLRNISATQNAQQWFVCVENYRLRHRVLEEFPGLERDMNLLEKLTDTHIWTLPKQIKTPSSDVEDTLDVVLEHLEQSVPASPPYFADFDLTATRQRAEERLDEEKEQLKVALGELLEAEVSTADKEVDVGKLNFEIKKYDRDKDHSPELQLDGETIQASEKVEQLLKSMLLDLDNLPSDWLDAGGKGDYGDSDQDNSRQDGHWLPQSERDGVALYDEWDFRRKGFRQNWCAVFERPGPEADSDFVDDTLAEYSSLVKDIRRQFEAIRGANTKLKAQADGDDVDFDALVDAYADMRLGSEMSELLFTQTQNKDRSLSVAFMVDVSGSTKGWINDAERQSLVLLCEALNRLGDQYAIYGFSGMTRNRCDVFEVKRFDQLYNETVRRRISGLSPQDYTRMGPAIRHLCDKLVNEESKTRLLITLSDGKPDDYDGYRGQYGIEDTRHALLEARSMGIHAFCITIDKQAGDYLPYMYGPASFVLVDDVRKLPHKVVDVYRRLTT